ncbi:acetate uptake transporter family protein [Streptomyces sp. NBC_01283]|uniref:GPR1/FUN34/YaaH family transporter n=1 Tax=Streptomyces sp. NBC_01283 TaxID=2903812 RepID=UPI00352E3C3A|nr:acetate uptake transporter family protein [Streptomyces sp. NBC_01283]
MHYDGSARGTTTSALGHLALGLTLLAFGLGTTRVINGVTAADAITIATYVGGIALFVSGVLAFHEGSPFNGTAFAGLGAFWFAWTSIDSKVAANAAGLFLALFALLALSLVVGTRAESPFLRGTYGLLFLALLLLASAQFADSLPVAKAAGWVTAVAGAAFWYSATASLGNWPTGPEPAAVGPASSPSDPPVR